MGQVSHRECLTDTSTHKVYVFLYKILTLTLGGQDLNLNVLFITTANLK